MLPLRFLLTGFMVTASQLGTIHKEKQVVIAYLLSWRKQGRLDCIDCIHLVPVKILEIFAVIDLRNAQFGYRILNPEHRDLHIVY